MWKVLLLFFLSDKFESHCRTGFLVHHWGGGIPDVVGGTGDHAGVHGVICALAGLGAWEGEEEEREGLNLLSSTQQLC